MPYGQPYGITSILLTQGSLPWKSVQIYMVEWIGRNFDVFHGFQKFLAMRNITLWNVWCKFDSIVFYTVHCLIFWRQCKKLQNVCKFPTLNLDINIVQYRYKNIYCNKLQNICSFPTLYRDINIQYNRNSTIVYKPKMECEGNPFMRKKMSILWLNLSFSAKIYTFLK